MTEPEPHVRPYQTTDEEAWVRCRVLGFLHTAYFDDVEPTKPQREPSAVELVAIRGGQLVGVLDATVADDEATIDTVAVHPDHRRAGVGTALLRHLLPLLAERGVATVDAWTRQDAEALSWYQRSGFTEKFRYLHVFADGADECRALLGPIDGSLVQQAFAHIVELDREPSLRATFRRVYTCRRLERPIG